MKILILKQSDCNPIERKVYKYGISGGRIRRDGKSSRAEQQVRKLNGTNGSDYESKIIKKDVSREKALSIEQGKVNAYSVSAQKTGHTGIRSNGKSESANGPISPEGNISPTAKI